MSRVLWAVTAAVFGLDQLSKFIAVRSLNIDESLPVAENIFHFTLILNTGAAFGLLKGAVFFFIAVGIFAVCAITLYARKMSKPFFPRDMALGLILGGVLGNLADRLRFGYVIDFLDFRIWPVFNLADSAVTIGAILLIISVFKIKSRKM